LRYADVFSIHTITTVTATVISKHTRDINTLAFIAMGSASLAAKCAILEMHKMFKAACSAREKPVLDISNLGWAAKKQ
jgi:hypothetical protein